MLLLLVIVAWATNLSVVKVAVRDFPVHAFNALRLIVAAAAFGVVLWRAQPVERRVARADWGRVVLLGLVGGTLYQMLFMSGVPRTSVANSGLIFGLSPVAISILSSLVGHERLSWVRWAGAVLSVVGLYFVVGVGATLSVNSLAGDAFVFAAMLGWAVYSVASRPLLGRYSPTILTAWASIVAVPGYLLFAAPSLAATHWGAVSLRGWALMLWSSTLLPRAGLCHLVHRRAAPRRHAHLGLQQSHPDCGHGRGVGVAGGTGDRRPSRLGRRRFWPAYS